MSTQEIDSACAWKENWEVGQPVHDLMAEGKSEGDVKLTQQFRVVDNLISTLGGGQELMSWVHG